MKSPSTRVVACDGPCRISEIVHIIRMTLLAGELITHEIAGFVRISNRHSAYGLGRASMCRRAPIVAVVSRDKRSVSTSTIPTCFACKEASDDDLMMF